MLYICIPAHDEAPTVGLLLWKIRKVFQEYSREYEIIVYDDASDDGTAETLRGYTEVLPLTIIGSRERVGYRGALEACCREANKRSRYPRRDALVVMQADFTDAPERLPELVRRFEGGADIVTAERTASAGMPAGVRRLRKLAKWIIGARGKTLGTDDPLSAYRLYRIAVIRELFKRAGDGPLLSTSDAAANAELLIAASRVARRLESVSAEPRYDLRQRPSRSRALGQARALLKLRKIRPVAEAARA